MPKFVMLLTWTQAAAAADQVTEQTLKALAEPEVSVESFLLTMGSVDAVAVLDGEANAVAAIAVALSLTGTVRTQTLSAFDSAQSAEIVNDAKRIGPRTEGTTGTGTGGTGGGT
jgi:uncharacterized protein with GYD domain